MDRENSKHFQFSNEEIESLIKALKKFDLEPKEKFYFESVDQYILVSEYIP